MVLWYPAPSLWPLCNMGMTSFPGCGGVCFLEGGKSDKIPLFCETGMPTLALDMLIMITALHCSKWQRKNVCEKTTSVRAKGRNASFMQDSPNFSTERSGSPSPAFSQHRCDQPLRRPVSVPVSITLLHSQASSKHSRYCFALPLWTNAYCCAKSHLCRMSRPATEHRSAHSKVWNNSPTDV